MKRAHLGDPRRFIDEFYNSLFGEMFERTDRVGIVEFTCRIGKPGRVADFKTFNRQAALDRFLDQEVGNVASLDVELGAIKQSHSFACATGNIEHLAFAVCHQELDLEPGIAIGPGFEHLRHFGGPVEIEVLAIAARFDLLRTGLTADFLQGSPQQRRAEISNDLLHALRRSMILRKTPGLLARSNCLTWPMATSSVATALRPG